MIVPIFLTTETSFSIRIRFWHWDDIVAVLGLVFIALSVLWAVIAAFGYLIRKQRRAKRETEAVVPVNAAVTQDDALIAVICAAIEAYRAEEGLSSVPYRVVAFKRRNVRKSWTGNEED